MSYEESEPLPHRHDDADRPGRARLFRRMPRGLMPREAFARGWRRGGGAPPSNEFPGHEERMALYTERAGKLDEVEAAGLMADLYAIASEVLAD